MYQLAEKFVDVIWEVVLAWGQFSKATLVKQMVRAADNIGANITEGIGRGGHPDNRRFARIARGSLNATQYWLRRAYKRGLLTVNQINEIKPMLDELAPRLNAYLNSIGKTKKTNDQSPMTTND